MRVTNMDKETNVFLDKANGGGGIKVISWEAERVKVTM